MGRFGYRVGSLLLCLISAGASLFDLLARIHLIDQGFLDFSLLETVLILFDVLGVCFSLVALAHYVWPDRSWDEVRYRDLIPLLLLIADLGLIALQVVWGVVMSKQMDHVLLELFWVANWYDLCLNATQLSILWRFLHEPSLKASVPW